MKRIAIIGSSGSGKSTFSEKLGKRLNLPVVHLDAYFHTAGWNKVSKSEWDKIHGEFIDRKEWILDGNYRRTLDLRLDKADTVIFLGVPKWLALYRVIKRRIVDRKTKRPDLPDFLDERLSWILTHKILSYSREDILERLKNHTKDTDVIVLKGSKEIEKFLDSLK